jgi:hypothetical protein
MTGMPAKISSKIGGKWSAFGGSTHGRNIMFMPGKMIVQSWRSNAFNKSDTDSILVITFTEVRGGSRVDVMKRAVSPAGIIVVVATQPGGGSVCTLGQTCTSDFVT